MNFIWLYKSFLAIFIVCVTVASCGELIQEMPDQDKLIIPVGTSMTSRVLGAREAESTPLEGSWDICEYQTDESGSYSIRKGFEFDGLLFTVVNRIFDNTNCEGIEYAKISQLSSFDMELTQSDDSGRIYDFNFTALELHTQYNQEEIVEQLNEALGPGEQPYVVSVPKKTPFPELSTVFSSIQSDSGFVCLASATAEMDGSTEDTRANIQPGICYYRSLSDGLEESRLSMSKSWSKCETDGLDGSVNREYVFVANRFYNSIKTYESLDCSADPSSEHIVSGTFRMVEAADSGRTELGTFGASINLVYSSESKVYYTDDLVSAANANNEFSESNWLKGEIKVNTGYEANILHDIASWENDELCLGDKSGLSTGESFESRPTEYSDDCFQLVE